MRLIHPRELGVARPTTPIALTIAGSDSSGGAGIQADLKTFTALGVYGASVLTALTAQNTCGVDDVLVVPADFIRAQVRSVASDLEIGAVKTGMLGDRETVLTVAALLKEHALKPVVVDPVMVATSGDLLLEPDAIAALKSDLLPLADVLTPNLPEAARLLDVPEARTLEEMRAQAEALLALGPHCVLLKGGHGTGEAAIDVAAVEGTVETLSLPRIDTGNTHGTGCTLSAAITAFLALGLSPWNAINGAKEFVWQALKSAEKARIGHGAGPVDHLFAIRGRPFPV